MSPIEPAGRGTVRETRFRRDLLGLLVPRRVHRRRLASILARIHEHDADAVRRRVDYCNQISRPFALGPEATRFRLRPFGKKHRYFLDLYELARYYDPHLELSFRFGDKTHVPEVPTFVKARPIGDGNENAILLPLNRARHFRFVQDDGAFRSKLDKLVWRGTAFQPRRQQMLAAYHDHPLCDVGETGKQSGRTPWTKPFLPIRDQLAYKYVLSIEGNDVATNLKWILSSRSLCFMPRPRHETWFMEGTLVPGRHYVLVRDDFADLEDRIRHYAARPDEAESILGAANEHAAQFLVREREELVALLVLRKYFQASGQLPPD